jgi:hypothetical protein
MTFHADDLAATAIIALAASGISMSFTQGSMFDSLRKWIADRNKLIGDLARCFFCMSHWVAIAGVAIYLPRPVRFWLPADLVVSVFVAVAIATIVSGLMFASFLGAMHTHVLRERVMSAIGPKPVANANADGVHAAVLTQHAPRN